MSLFSPAAKAVAQLDDPVFVRVVLHSLLWAVVGFAALATLVVYGAQALVGSVDPSHRWLRWIAGLLSGAGAVVGALYLFLPVATVIATLFVNSVSGAVEHRYYPALPPARPASLADQTWDGIALGVRVLLLEIVGLAITLVLPGLGAVIGWAIAAWAIGRGLFVAVAMRRMDRPAAVAVYERHRLPILAQGGLVAVAGWVPVLNLVAPVLGIAALVHVLHASYGKKGGRFAGRRAA